jgi:ABC-type branched-subunit amino acid transport system ATPase component
VSLRAPTGRITGLIGPNGAGKTTIFNACSGLVRPSGGSVHLSGTDITRSPVARRARAGLGRTFQHFELFDSLSVRQNVALGAEGAFAGANPLGHMLATPVQQREVKSATEAALDSCELRAISDSTVGSLSTGQRRLVELARCLAGDFRLLLLDEPSSGLDSAETVRFGRMLRAAVEERGIGVLLVEHDMTLVTEFCDYLYVVDFGRLVFEGTPGEAVASPVVQAAYLGSPELEEVPA